MNGIRTRQGTDVSQDKEHPPCFGDPNAVCPRDEEGFSQPQAGCLPCEFLRSCLQHALRKQGVIGAPPVVTKVTHFLRRWSDQKLSRADSPGDETSADES